MKTTQVQPGANVEHNGMVLGTVERVLTDQTNGALEALLIRHGRTDYLLQVPARYVVTESPQRVRLDTSLDLDEVERAAIESGRTPPTGHHLTDAGHTEPSPLAEEVAGDVPGMPRSHDGPATG